MNHFCAVTNLSWTPQKIDFLQGNLVENHLSGYKFLRVVWITFK